MFISTVAHQHSGTVVDTGHCVRYCQVATPVLPHTSKWRKGRKVRGSDVPTGAVIATFDSEGRYTNKTDGSMHAAIFVKETDDGLLVWDQWLGQPVHQRIIRFKNGNGLAVNDGDQFYVVEG